VSCQTGTTAAAPICYSQTTDYCPGGHHLAVDHLKQLHRVDAQLHTELEYIRTLITRKFPT
jgi:hypothetical protein